MKISSSHKKTTAPLHLSWWLLVTKAKTKIVPSFQFPWVLDESLGSSVEGFPSGERNIPIFKKSGWNWLRVYHWTWRVEVGRMKCPKSGPICLVFRGGFLVSFRECIFQDECTSVVPTLFFKDPLEKTKPFPVSLSQHTFHNMNTIQGPTHWWWNQGFGWHCGMKATAWTHIWRASLRRRNQRRQLKRRTPEQYFVWSWSKNGLTS